MQPKAGLSVLSTRDLLEGGASGPAINPGKPEQSSLVRVTAKGSMPPAGPKLTKAEVAKLFAWVKAGAPGRRDIGGHWAFSPLKPQNLPSQLVKQAKPNVKKQHFNPTVENQKSKIKNPIDRFLLAKLKAKGLSFSPPADRRTLIRRLTFDLIGLPPTPEEVSAFEADILPDAYARLVDRLLADPRYGERWGRHWLDAAGYADSEGVLEEDAIRTNSWRYRDWVIRALNADMPYDRFLQEQIAGDELVPWRTADKFTPEIQETLTATGFLRTAVDATRDDFNTHQFVEYQYRMLFDTEQMVSTAVLGIPLQCARCHDHKYEPLSQRDYYRVQALFMGAIRPEGKLLPTRRRQIVAATQAEQKHAADVNAKADADVKRLNEEEQKLLLDSRMKLLENRLKQANDPDKDAILGAARKPEAMRTADEKSKLAKYIVAVEATTGTLEKEFPEFKPTMERIRQERDAANRSRIAFTEIRALYDQDANPAETKLLVRGDISRKGEPVAAGIPLILDDSTKPFAIKPVATESTGRRLAFAQWLTRPEHPLTARVFVNRVWAHHFGEGIVTSMENFGRSGARPTHPELLDWLAWNFATGGLGDRPWSIKALQRTIVMSAAYRQSSTPNRVASATDPDNRLLWRFRPRRLEAEAVRDSVLAVSGALDMKMFGEPVGLDYRAAGEVVVAGEDKTGRRSLYVLVRRSKPVTVLGVFDAPFIEINCTRRAVSTTASQSLALMNGSFLSAQAKNFAKRILAEQPLKNGVVSANAVARAFNLVYGRKPNPIEQGWAGDLLRKQQQLYSRAGQNAETSTTSAWTDLCQALLGSNEFLYID
jgi:hypothetical protein